MTDGGGVTVWVSIIEAQLGHLGGKRPAATKLLRRHCAKSERA
jgi:hypothetical protein